MQKAHVREPKSFGNRKEPHSITITRNGKSRHYAINPTYFTVFAGFIAMFLTGYLVATTYLVLRDDLISANTARQARLQHEYEDKIAALRTNLDRVKSRQLLDQQALEVKITEMIERQKRLGAHGSLMSQIVEKAKTYGIGNVAKTKIIDPVNTGSIIPDKEAFLKPAFANSFTLRGVGEIPQIDSATVKLAQNNNNYASDEMRDAQQFSRVQIRPVFDAVSTSLAMLDKGQKSTVNNLRKSASAKTFKIVKLLKKAGAKFPKKFNKQIGGPFVEVDLGSDFSTHMEALDTSLEILKKTQAKIENFPVASPAKNHTVTSKFGTRLDPFRRKYAMHSGIDFRGAYGDKVKSTARGKIVHASRKGGYGKMVEIDHGNGRTTRYAHLSKIKVKLGQTIKLGQVIGTIGSTGRSTGPHLHYEVRVHGKAVNPKAYLNIGKKLKNIL